MSERAARRGGIIAWLASIEDGAILRAAFFALLLGTAGVLFIDYRELTQNDLTVVAAPFHPVLPAFNPDGPAMAPGPAVTTAPDLLSEPLKVVLGPGGVLSLTGTIDPGAAARVADEVAAHGEYIKVVALDSPGGSVNDALAIGNLIARAGYDTRVAAGSLCASSCPLAFAGGKARHATPQSAIGVHQIYAAISSADLPIGARAAGDAMSDAQKTTAMITRYLTGMGVDPAMWLNALETPPDRLYYFTPKELTDLRLVTAMDEPA